MLNPFILLTPPLLNAMLGQPMYFVRQYYPRGLTEGGNDRTPLLFTHYSQHEIDRERAQRHMRLLWNDHFRFLYDSTNPVHTQKLKTAALQPEGYKIYTNVLLQDWKPPRHIKSKVYCYLKNKLFLTETALHQPLKFHLQDLFGQLYLGLSWRGNKVEVLLDEIENIYADVL